MSAKYDVLKALQEKASQDNPILNVDIQKVTGLDVRRVTTALRALKVGKLAKSVGQNKTIMRWYAAPGAELPKRGERTNSPVERTTGLTPGEKAMRRYQRATKEVLDALAEQESAFQEVRNFVMPESERAELEELRRFNARFKDLAQEHKLKKRKLSS